MKKVDITIIQKPTDVVFICPQCRNDIEVSYRKFENITGSDLGEIINDRVIFNCPECSCSLEIGEVELD